MKPMQIFGIFAISAASLILQGCGGKNADQPPVVQPGAPVPYGQYQQQQSQPYVCQAGYIQLRTPNGGSQCYTTTDIAQACNQAGRVLAAGGLCRFERPLPGRLTKTFRTFNRRGNRTAYGSIPLNVSLYMGESLKVMGNVESDSRYNSDWNAELLQNGMVVGTADGGVSFDSQGNNLIITGVAGQNYGQQVYGQPAYGQIYPQNYGQNPQYQQYPQQYPPQTGGQCYASPNGVCNPGYYPTAGQCCANGAVGGYQQNYSQVPTPQMYQLNVYFSGQVTLDLRGAAVSCEDGRGNSYPCQ
jgi:hypothetical protein